MKEKMIQAMAEHIDGLIKLKKYDETAVHDISESWFIIKAVLAPAMDMTAEEARKAVADRIAVINLEKGGE